MTSVTSHGTLDAMKYAILEGCFIHGNIKEFLFIPSLGVSHISTAL